MCLFDTNLVGTVTSAETSIVRKWFFFYSDYFMRKRAGLTVDSERVGQALLVRGLDVLNVADESVEAVLQLLESLVHLFMPAFETVND